jgi:hypothetical protein
MTSFLTAVAAWEKGLADRFEAEVLDGLSRVDLPLKANGFPADVEPKIAHIDDGGGEIVVTLAVSFTDTTSTSCPGRPIREPAGNTIIMRIDKTTGEAQFERRDDEEIADWA